jgi:hypothetical protein
MKRLNWTPVGFGIACSKRGWSFRGVADLADETATVVAFGDALFGQEVPSFSIRPTAFGDGFVAGEAVVQQVEALAHLRGGECLGFGLLLVGEHQVKHVRAGGRGGERGARIVFLLQAVVDGFLGEFGGGGSEFRTGAELRLR